jgi:acyl dehydratase
LIEVDRPQDLAAYAKQRIGHSRPVRVDQGMIDRFAELSGDRNWIHVDTERAAREMPDGKTIVHGLLLLSLAPTLKDDVYRIRRRGKGVNYGYDRVRFVRPVQVGDAVRLAVTVLAVDPHRAGTRIEVLHELENAGTGEVVLSAHNILLVADA